MFKDVIRLERKKLGLTQDKFAKLLNTTRQNVTNWETGYNIPSTEMMLHISNILHCSTDYLLGKTDKRTIYEEFDNKYDIDLQEIENLEKLSKHLTEEQKEELGFYTFTDTNEVIGAGKLLQGLYDMNLLKKNEPITDKQIEIILEFLENNKSMIQTLMNK